ncbi:hypothetical protein VU07_01225 [Desulfobulbus sp. F4]|nr:hypothetical protein [Desulfobulbus sp. F4]
MDTFKTVSGLKQRPGFTDKVGMILIHNDVLREHVKPVLSELLDRIKAEAVRKQELSA